MGTKLCTTSVGGPMQAQFTAQLAVLREKIPKAKGRQGKKRVKREPSPIHMYRSGDVVDLTLN
jgi:hypothetical protein